jgi:hypothetical protein
MINCSPEVELDLSDVKTKSSSIPTGHICNYLPTVKKEEKVIEINIFGHCFGDVSEGRGEN